MNDDFIPPDFRNPYERLEELEVMVTSQGIALEEACAQLKLHSDNFVQISQALIQIADAIQKLHISNRQLDRQCKQLKQDLQRTNDENQE